MAGGLQCTVARSAQRAAPGTAARADGRRRRWRGGAGMTQRAKIAAGTRVAFQEQEWTVVMLQGLQVQLVGDDGVVASVLLPHLLADAHFRLHGEPAPEVVGPLALLETLPQPVRETALE